MDINKLKGGLYGFAIGDALGVPYEFLHSSKIPNKEDIIYQSSRGIKSGTWSDDTSQLLCLFESLEEQNAKYNNKLDLYKFGNKLLQWRKGHMWLDGYVFDIGNQTDFALMDFQDGKTPEECGFAIPNGCGNGSLMRCFAVVLYFYKHNMINVKNIISELSQRQSIITHGNEVNLSSCVLYNQIAQAILLGLNYKSMINNTMDNKSFKENILYGNGYVIDTLATVIKCINETNNYEDAIKMAISFGNDTDTTAALTGGLAGIIYGYDNIPKYLIDGLRGKNILDKFIYNN